MSETRLPFRLFESGIERLRALIHAGTDTVRDVMTASPSLSGDASPESREGDAGADAAATETDAASDLAPGPGATATAAAALATAIDAQGSADIADHSKASSVVPDGMIVDDASEPVAPDEELGPEPFAPQVGL